MSVCCRRDGKHHCMMTDVERSQQAGHDTHIHAPIEKCPYGAPAFAVFHGATYVPLAAQAIFAALVAHPAHTAQVESKLRISEDRSRQKRGPPSSLSL